MTFMIPHKTFASFFGIFATFNRQNTEDTGNYLGRDHNADYIQTYIF